MDQHEQVTLAQGIGRIEGTMSALAKELSQHTGQDDRRFERQDERSREQFDTLSKKLDEIKDQRGEDLAQQMIKDDAVRKTQAEIQKWKWTIAWTLIGTALGAIISQIVAAIIKANLGG